jgi:hypothetical protein
MNEFIFRSGKPWGVGILGRGGGYMSQGREIGEQFTSNLGTRWMDPVTTRRVPSKLKGTEQGSKESKGSKGRKRKKMFMYISILVSCT